MMMLGALGWGGPDSRAVGGAAIGAVAAGTAVAATYKTKSVVERYHSDVEKAQVQVICELIEKHMDGICDRSVLDDLRETSDDIRSASPAFPHVKLCFDAIRSYQKSRRGGGMFACAGIRDHKGRSDPRNLACEFVKAWLREKIEDHDIDPSEIVAYRNFCRGFIMYDKQFPQHNKLSFVQVMGHVSQHLNALLRLRLQQTRSCAGILARLREESYAFVLHAIKLLLLAPTSCELPAEMYSTDSLAWLRRTALNPEMLQSDFERGIAQKMAPFWHTDTGRLVRQLLLSPHGLRICEQSEGPALLRSVIRIHVLRAENLPDLSWMDTVDPYVVAEVRRLSSNGMPEKVSSACTQPKMNCRNPVWEETLDVDVPNGEDVSVHLKLKDFNEMSKGLVNNITFAEVPALSADVALEYASSNREAKVRLSTTGQLKQEKLKDACLHVRFESFSFEKDLATVRKTWEKSKVSGQANASSGLFFLSLAEPFLKAAEALDNLTYFLDILSTQCLEVARLLGDLGMVFCAKVIKPLLDEVEQRVLACEKLCSTEMLDQVYAARIEAARTKKWFRSTSRENDNLVEESASKLRRLKATILGTIQDLRHACDQYDGVSNVLEQAHKRIESLVGKLRDGETMKRSDRFQGAVQELETDVGASLRRGWTLEETAAKIPSPEMDADTFAAAAPREWTPLPPSEALAGDHLKTPSVCSATDSARSSGSSRSSRSSSRSCAPTRDAIPIEAIFADLGRRAGITPRKLGGA